ncbi:lysophosphatidic acid receptor 6-like [Bombina bombina]|uniref:lysophosphatidic acid receptor 6-like n=1 Tax=Bombina bombina TaxID=8345 RepID=UPI00235AE3E9|nr:lysophosphatidic acid receptor 6-like [Bombina bombina]
MDMPLTPTVIPFSNSSEECNLEADFQYGFYTIIYSLVFILGLPGNVSALYFLSRQSQRSRSSNIYFVNLSMVDTVFICLLPIRIYYHNNGNNWEFGDVTCRITGALFYANIYLSISFFTFISLDRYLAVVHPLIFLRLKSSKYPLFFTIVIWVISCAILLPLTLGGPLANVSENSSQTSCFENFSPNSWQGRLIPYNVCALIFGFLVPFTVIAVVFPVMARRVCQIRKSIHRKVALWIIGFILAVSLLCFLPYHITHLLYFLMRLKYIQHCSASNHIYKLRRITLALVSLNSCLNPLIYFIPSLSRRLNHQKTEHIKRVYSVTDDKPSRDKFTYTLTDVPSQQEMDITLKAKAEWVATPCLSQRLQ